MSWPIHCQLERLLYPIPLSSISTSGGGGYISSDWFPLNFAEGGVVLLVSCIMVFLEKGKSVFRWNITDGVKSSGLKLTKVQI